METWNLEGTLEAVWSSLPPPARISPGSLETRKNIIQGGIGDESCLHTPSVRHHCLPSTQRRTWKGEGTTSFPAESMEHLVLLRKLTPWDMNTCACV